MELLQLRSPIIPHKVMLFRRGGILVIKADPVSKSTLERGKKEETGSGTIEVPYGSRRENVSVWIFR